MTEVAIYRQKLALLSDDDFVEETVTRIWLSAFANNNFRSAYHWQADACYEEAQRREKPDLYTRAFERASAKS